MICVVLPVILCNHMNTSICYISDNCQSINLNINLSINSKLLFQEKYNEPKKEKVIEKVTKDGKTFFKINDYMKLKEIFG